MGSVNNCGLFLSGRQTQVRREFPQLAPHLSTRQIAQGAGVRVGRLISLATLVSLAAAPG